MFSKRKLGTKRKDLISANSAALIIFLITTEWEILLK